MTTLDAAATPPSLDVLTEAARQVGARYPELFAHQRSGVTFLLARRRAILAGARRWGPPR